MPCNNRHECSFMGCYFVTFDRKVLCNCNLFLIIFVITWLRMGIFWFGVFSERYVRFGGCCWSHCCSVWWYYTSLLELLKKFPQFAKPFDSLCPIKAMFCFARCLMILNHTLITARLSSLAFSFLDMEASSAPASWTSTETLLLLKFCRRSIDKRCILDIECIESFPSASVAFSHYKITVDWWFIHN